MDSITQLLLLGVAFHLSCIFSIFDIYFQSHVESFIPNANYTSSPPAKRVIIFTLDGCRVDKLFKVVAGFTDHYDLNPESTENVTFSSDNRSSFLGDVMRHRGSWGVSHNHAPTESRPCHVALTAGMYEDPHAVYKSWKQHPVPFDSVFNQSSSSFIYGNKDVAPMLARHAPPATEEHYTAQEEVEMVRKDTTLLDVWIFRKVEELFTRGMETRDRKLYNQLHQEKLVIYCHFLGTDTTGPKYGADSREYLENIAVVDRLIEKTEKTIEEYYGNDGRTAYVVSTDHGMDLHGDHGDDAPAKTRTAIIAWGAGVHGPEMTTMINTNATGFVIELPTQSRAEVLARLESQVPEEQAAIREWGTLLDYKRKDVMQTDVAPLISALAGLPFSRNSVGVLPFTYLNKDKYRAKAMRANAQQLYNHVLRKEEVKRAHRGLLFIPYSSLHQRVSSLVAHLDEAIGSISESKHYSIHDDTHRVVEILSQEMIELCRSAIVYYHTYDCFFLLGSIVLGYVGWALVMFFGYLHPDTFRVRWLFTHTISVKFIATVVAVMWWRYLADSPLTYYLYGLCPLVFWKFVWSHRDQFRAVLPVGHDSWCQWSIQIAFLFVVLELVALGYQRRVIFSLLFMLLALQPDVANYNLFKLSGDIQLKERWHGKKLVSPSTCWSASCLLIAIFPCLSSELNENTPLVHIGALLVVAFACISIRSVSTIYAHISQRKAELVCGGLPVLLALLTLQWTTSFFDRNEVPPSFLVVANWVLAVTPPVWMIIETQCKSKTAGLRLVKHEDENDLECQQKTSGEVIRVVVERLTRVMLALTPALALLSTSYEVLFYLALCSALVSWLMMEADAAATEGVYVTREVQRALMVLLFAQVSFFGTTSVASMTNFQIPAIRRFLPNPAPFIAYALVVLKLLIPFVVVGCAFRLIILLPSTAVSTREKEMHGKSTGVVRYILVAVSFADILAVQLLFGVTNEGSWKQMGNSIAEFCIINAQIILLPTILFLAWIYVQDLECIGKWCDSVENDKDEKSN
ncbi:hypothetical protein KXD40_001946 [Peronospora effusa]|uniref:GPI ethanolamine phosphate transferase 1 n=1 Tax=Peronospora effusa TaxID=542832 RepID=A0A3M6VMV6_9STRA|nr:hypothetical protein DD238_001983 [Peronospora effusa]UIZ26017.1 hypothetical protein KXD40_001946 [Peronospora effusa]CAI5726224.1 unnamed protein product [Peronospora effusa]